MAVVVIDTSTATSPSGLSHQRGLDRTSLDVLWAVFYNGSAYEFWYSTDDGVSWGQDTGATKTPSTALTNGAASLYIDVNNLVHIVWSNRSGSNYYLYYDSGTLNAAHTTITWTTPSELIATASGTPRGEVVAFPRDANTTYVAVAIDSVEAAAGTMVIKIYERTISGLALVQNFVTGFAAGAAGAAMAPSIDFHHTGDGKTISGGTPHIYVVYHTGDTGAGKGIRFRKLVWVGGGWSANTDRGIDESNHADATAGLVSACFDGTRMVMAYRPSGSTSTVKWAERDSGDTTTTARTPTALADGVVQSVSVSYDNLGNGFILASAATSLDPKTVQLTRSSLTWGSWTAIEATTTRSNAATLQRGYSALYVRSLYSRGAGSPYDVVYDRTILAGNTAPSQATWDSPTDNQAADVAETLTLDWTFVDVDPGDSQSAYALRRQIGAASYEYWNAGTSSWGAGETQNTSATTSVTLSASWGADGDGNHKFAVKTWDSGGTVGSYSAELTVIPSGQDNPTISTPADAGTVTTALLTVTWSASTQTAYKAELLNTGATTVHESSGWVTSTATSHVFAYVMTNSTAYKVRITTRNDEGLASDADTNSFTTSFTPPATPTLVVTGGTPTGAIRVAVTNGAGPPATTSVHLYRREGTDSATSIRISLTTGSSPTYDDYAVESGVAYQYQAIGFADSGASATSAWTA